jgi:hypothetical protein
MGAAWDAMCENEGLQSTLSKKNRQIREQKKLIIELAKGIVKYCNTSESNSKEIENVRILQDKAVKILLKLNKKK